MPVYFFCLGSPGQLFLLAFMEESSGSPWKVMGDNFKIFFSKIPALKRVLEEHRNVAQGVYNFFIFMKMVVGNKDKR